MEECWIGSTRWQSAGEAGLTDGVPMKHGLNERVWGKHIFNGSIMNRDGWACVRS